MPQVYNMQPPMQKDSNAELLQELLTVSTDPTKGVYMLFALIACLVLGCTLIAYTPYVCETWK